MKIYVASAVGKGSTKLAAFDQALLLMGAANFNIIRLSSIIPASAEILVFEDHVPPIKGQWGDKLYAVYAEQRTDAHNDEAWAGIGWCRNTENNEGMFVEHHGKNEATVRKDIFDTLTDMKSNRNIETTDIEMKVVGGKANGQAICALVLAAYQTVGWH